MVYFKFTLFMRGKNGNNTLETIAGLKHFNRHLSFYKSEIGAMF